MQVKGRGHKETKQQRQISQVEEQVMDLLPVLAGGDIHHCRWERRSVLRKRGQHGEEEWGGQLRGRRHPDEGAGGHLEGRRTRMERK